MKLSGFLKSLLPHRTRIALRVEREYRRYVRKYGRQTQPRAHGLPGELIVSLTSYPPRFPTLHLTLKSLLNQSVRPDRIILWLAHDDFAKLPRAMRALLRRQIEVRLVPDVRSYKKLVFAIEEFPNAYIVTADDDLFYTPDWLAELVEGQGGASGVITCHRVHRIASTPDGGIAPYVDWDRDVQDDSSREPSRDLMPTGVGGILYPPGSLSPDVTRQDLYQELAPNADDLWFFWSARRQGMAYRKVGGPFPLLTWAQTQQHALFGKNVAGSENDVQLQKLATYYGNPAEFP